MELTDSDPAGEDEKLGRFLASTQAYPEPTTRVQLVETHISQVFLTDRFVVQTEETGSISIFSTSAQRSSAIRLAWQSCSSTGGSPAMCT